MRNTALRITPALIKSFKVQISRHFSFSSSPPLGITSRVQLNDGHSKPFFGLGVYQSVPGPETETAVYNALNAGYRHIDTAEFYQNEADVGKGIHRFLRESGCPRDEIYITTKFLPDGKGGSAVREAMESSLRKLNMDYVDLYLMHSPLDKDIRLEQWQQMEQLKTDGLTKSIGVSNYGIHHLEELLQNCRIKPVSNQLEVNPYITRQALAEYCNKHHIVVEAYSPLTKAIKLKDPKLVNMAVKYSLTPAQVLIRWCLQKGYIVIPKSVDPARIVENTLVFSTNISTEDMAILDGFDEYLVTGWDPTVAP